MKQRNWGRIVFISSESAINTPVEMIHYGMTKTAQLAVSRGLAQLCAGITRSGFVVGILQNSFDGGRSKNDIHGGNDDCFHCCLEPQDGTIRYLACQRILTRCQS